jgi:hypothetical protein
MTNTIQTQIINGHKVTIGQDKAHESHHVTFPWIQIDDSPKYFVDTDGDHWGSIGIDNPEDFKDTILYQFIDNENDNEFSESDEPLWTFDMGGMFCVVSGDNHWELIDEDECILTPLGMINNGNGAYGNG